MILILHSSQRLGRMETDLQHPKPFLLLLLSSLLLTGKASVDEGASMETHVSEKDLSVFLCKLETAILAASCTIGNSQKGRLLTIEDCKYTCPRRSKLARAVLLTTQDNSCSEDQNETLGQCYAALKATSLIADLPLDQLQYLQSSSMIMAVVSLSGSQWHSLGGWLSWTLQSRPPTHQAHWWSHPCRHRWQPSVQPEPAQGKHALLPELLRATSCMH